MKFVLKIYIMKEDVDIFLVFDQHFFQLYAEIILIVPK